MDLDLNCTGKLCAKEHSDVTYRLQGLVRYNTLLYRLCTLAVLLDDQGERVQHHGQRDLRRSADHEEDLRVPDIVVSEGDLPSNFVPSHLGRCY